jgi:hypothetical protein
VPRLHRRLTDTGVIYLESGPDFAPGPDWHELRSGQAGQVHFRLVRPSRSGI